MIVSLEAQREPGYEVRASFLFLMGAHLANLDRILPVLAPVLRKVIRPGQIVRQRQFEAMPVPVGRVLFLGDSITHQGDWEGWFPELPTLNRGIGGHAICDLLARLDSAINEPRAISLMIAANDLHGLGLSREVPAIADQMRALVERIQEMAPTAKLFINSVTPRSTHFRDRIIQLNDRNRQIAADSHSTYVDLWPSFAGPDGAILPHLSPDGLHLSGEGYKAWTEVLRPHLLPFAN